MAAESLVAPILYLGPICVTILAVVAFYNFLALVVRVLMLFTDVHVNPKLYKARLLL